MATDSTNLPQGEANTDASTDMAGSELDLAAVQLAQVEGAQPVDLPKGNQIVRIPVNPGDVIQLPTDSTDHLLAKIGPEGNLAFVIDGRTIILQGYVEANEQSPVKIVTNDGDTITPADVIASTDPNLDITTAAGPATGGQGDQASGSGIFVPFAAGPGLGLIDAEGVLGATALQYKVIDDEQKQFVEGEEDARPDFNITFDILGGVINEDDLPADQIIQENPQQELALASKFILGGSHHSGTNGEGNDPFDPTDREEGGADSDGDDGYPDPDREPLVTVATVDVNFHGEVPGTLTIDTSLLPTGLKSEGEDIVYEIIPAGGGKGTTIIAFVDNGGGLGFDDGTDRAVFKIEVNEEFSNGAFHVTFTLFDNIDNKAPDSLLGADEQILGLPTHFIIEDSNGTQVPGTLDLGVEDDIPFFGKVVGCEAEINIVGTDVGVTHDETKGVDWDADDVSPYNPFIQAVRDEVKDGIGDAGIKLPGEVGEYEIKGAAKTTVHVSFGADGPAVHYDDSIIDTNVRNSVFGALLDAKDGTVDDKDGNGNGAENEHPFELFLVNAGTDGKPTDGDLTIDDVTTNVTVTWNGDDEHPLPVRLRQIDANTIIGFVDAPDGESTTEVAVLAIHIDDAGCLTFLQYHQINHPDTTNNDEPINITDSEGNPLVWVRATDFDGDHAIAPVNMTVEDDGPSFKGVSFDHGEGTVDEDALSKGNHDLDITSLSPLVGAPGDNQPLDIFPFTSGQIKFDIGVDKPGHLSFAELTVTNSKGEDVPLSELKTADGHGIHIVVSDPDADGVVTYQGLEDGSNDPVFTMTLDTEGGEMGDFKFTLNQALQHPFTDSDFNNDDNPEERFEDDLNFAFKVTATDIDKDTASGTINIVVDDDSPRAFDDHDEVTEGTTKGSPNFASGNVVTGGDDGVLGKDANFTFLPPLLTGDGTPDLPGADRPYTISKLQHDGHTYNLIDHGEGSPAPRFEVAKDGGSLDAGESFDETTGILKIGTHEGGTLEIILENSNQSLVGEYRYTVPADADHSLDKHFGPADLANTRSSAFDTAQEWVDKFSADGITLTALGGTGFAIKNVDVNPKTGFGGAEDYRGLGITPGIDSAEVDTKAPETLQLAFATLTDNAKVLIGALFDGNQFDAGSQEILKWTAWDSTHTTIIASGQIVGDFDGLVTLDVDTNGQAFKYLELTPLDNGAGSNSGNNSDFLLINVETCCPEDKFTESFDYTLRDADGDESTAKLSIDVKDTEPKVPFTRDFNVKFTVDEDGLPGIGIGDHASKDAEEAHGGINAAVDDAVHKGNISFTPGVDPVTIELSVGNGGDTGLDTVDGKNIFAAWDDATHTLIGYIQGTDPSDAANRVFTMTITDAQTGAFTFTLLKPMEHPNTDTQGANDNTENQTDLSFIVDIQIEDKDCDVAYAQAKVTIDDDMPTITQLSSNFVLSTDESLDGNTVPNNAGDDPNNPGFRIEDDEDGANLPGSLPGGAIGASKGAGSSFFSFNAGADGLESAVYSLSLTGGSVATALKDTATDSIINLTVNGNIIEGRSATGNFLVFAFTVNSSTGEVAMAQYRAVVHPTDNPDEEAILGTGGLKLNLAVTDKDGDTVTSSVDITGKIKIDDDGPHADLDRKDHAKVVVDESVGFESGDSNADDETDAGANPGDIGFIKVKASSLFDDDSDYGTDGPGHKEFSLSLLGNDSGIDDTETGKDVLLFKVGNTIEGRIDNNAGALVFTITVDPTNGDVTVHQLRAVEHNNPNDPEESNGSEEVIDANKILLNLLVVDKDGDSDADTLDLGQLIKFEDDGPKTRLHVLEGAKIVLDESLGADVGDGNADDETKAGANPADIGFSKVAAASLFTETTDYGSDKQASSNGHVFTLSLPGGNNSNSGLDDVQTNSDVRLFLVGGQIQGRSQTGNNLVFTIDVNPSTGEVTVHQLRAIEHNDPSDPDEPGSSAAVMSTDRVQLNLTVTDGDGDHDSDHIDLGKLIKFEDDGPKALDDVDVIESSDGGVTFFASGNVITGANTTTGVAGADDGGTDIPASITKLQGVNTDSNASNGLSVNGTYGTLTLNPTTGQYTYDFDEATWKGKVPSGSTEVFTYTLTDKDGDSDPATLTIKLGEATVETRVAVDPQGDGCLEEDTYGIVQLNALPGSGDTVTKLVVENIPGDWDVKTGTIALSSGTVGSVTFIGGVLTINVSGATAGVLLTANVEMKAGPDSDLDGNDLKLTATAVDGVVFATKSTVFDVIVDAVADGDDKGDDGDADKLSVQITVSDSGDVDSSFATNEVGNVHVHATFDDYKDGSETHTLTVEAPANFLFDHTTYVPPAGVTLDPSSTDSKLVLIVDSENPGGLGSVDLDIPVKYVGGLGSGESGDFTATATAEEGQTEAGNTGLPGDDKDGNEECDDGNNKDSATDTDKAEIFQNQVPIAYDDEACGDEAAPKNVNLLLVFDNSGSMNNDSGIPGATKLDAAKASAIALLNELSGTGGDVRVMLVTFNSDSTREPTWLSLSDAIDAINNISPSGGSTNYEEAILDAISGYNDPDGRGDLTTHSGLVYFLSDGEPTTGGNSGDHSITDGTLADWDALLENASNNIEHVYAVGLGTGIPDGANNSNLKDVASPDGDNNAPNDVILVDDFNDLTGTLTGTVGSLISGNILDGSNENDPDGPNAGINNDPDFLGDTPTHVSLFKYDNSDDTFDITITYDGNGDVEPGEVTGGKNASIDGTKVSFDTEFGRMTFDFSNGHFDFVAGPVDGGEKEEIFDYKLTDSNGDESNPATLTICIDDKFVDLKPVTYDDVAEVTEPAPKNVNLLMVFDNSGSMNDPSGIPGASKLQAARTAAINLLNSYAATGGDVKVMLVTFNANATREATWLDLADAINAINNIPSSNGNTNYEQAILNAISGFNDTDNRGDFTTHDNVVYFLSDGEPTTGGNAGDNSITDGTLASWDSLLESPTNDIQHVYAVGLGTGIPSGASNPNLLDVANPVNDGVNETPNTVILVDDFNDLSATLIATVGTPVEGNILDGSNESDPDGPNAGAGNDPDTAGDPPHHISLFEYDSADNDLDIKVTWDGTGDAEVDAIANGKGTTIVGTKVSFDTDHGRMTIDVDDGHFKFLASQVSGGDQSEVFEYKTTDNDGDESNESKLTITIHNLPPAVSINDTALDEGKSGNLTLKLSEAAPTDADFTVTFGKVGDSATSGVDYTPGSVTVHVNAGATSALIPVNALPDGFIEGDEKYTVTISGGPGWAITDGTGIVTIHDVVVRPTTNAGSGSGNEDALDIAVSLSGADADGSVASFKITSLPSNGTLYLDAGHLTALAIGSIVPAVGNAATVHFVPAANFNGSPTFQYAAVDNTGFEDLTPALATITVNAVADPTVANADSIITAINNDATFTVPHFALLANDSDPDGPLSISQIVSFDGTNFDSVSLAGSNVSINTDDPFDPGDTATFTYKATDGTSSANAVVTVSAVANGNITGTDNGEIIVDNDNAHTINAGKGNDHVFANAGNDTVNGGDGDDYLDGGADNDTYTGGKGNDTIDAGSGDDTINYTSTLDGTDLILNFDANGANHDTLNLDALFDALGIATAARDARVQIVDNGSTVDVNVNADGAAGFELHVAVLNTTNTVDLGTDVTVGTL